jgi:23S rRNA pseudouridine1911/1915/1917 synthase
MQKIIADENSVGSRLDLFLVEEVFFNLGKTRGDMIRAIKNGEVLINKKSVKPSYILKQDDEIEVNLEIKKNQLQKNDKIKVEIIFQDENIVVINKPAGLTVHPMEYAETETLVNFLLAKFPEIIDVGDGSVGSEFRPGIVHRLDKDTTGVMVIARNQKAFEELKNLFQNRKIEKKYLAIVLGKIVPRQGVIEKDLARSVGHKRQVIAHKRTSTKVKPAITEYQVLKEFEKCSLVEAVPKTGRTHQIRIHFFSLGNPIIGDKTYRIKKNIVRIGAERQLLHAKELSFELFNKKHTFLADLPKDFNDFIKTQEVLTK